jgi:putative heme iron utilization protein
MSGVPSDKPKQVILETDGDAIALAKTLVREARSGALATIEKGSGHPFASLASVATDVDGAPVVLVSRLSGHTTNLMAEGRCSLLLGQPGKGDPLAHPRITLIADAKQVARDSAEGARVRRRFLARHPKAQLYVDFPDFGFFRIAPARASLNGGFGRAYELTAGDLLTDLSGADELVALEEGAVAHMNDDHGEAVRLYATRLLKGPDAPWRCAGVDPDGMDLVAGDLALRLPFPERVTDGLALRKLLKRLADDARAVA